METVRTCRICGEEKSLLENFLPMKKGLRGYDSRCKDCERKRQKARYHEPTVKQQYKERHIERTYGVSRDYKERKLEEQGNRCGICPSKDPKNTMGWQLDHNHTTGQVRGVLCQPCNRVVGYVEAGWEIDVPAVREYLEWYNIVMELTFTNTNP